MACLEDNTLVELVSGRLDEARRQAAIRHADGCDACRQLLAAAADELITTDGDAAAPPATPALRPGDVVGAKYRIERPLGQGGMGAVYEAVNTWTRRRVAIKMMHAAIAADATSLRRFMQEAQSAARVAHPNVVEVLDLGQDAQRGVPFLVHELLRGTTLRRRLDDAGRLAVDEAIALAVPVLSALVAAHESGVVHRDVKPENIFLVPDEDGRERPKLIDFGLSKRTAAGERLLVTEDGRPLGTPFYMSPEQVRGDADVDDRTDVWAMGVVLFEAVSGARPFRGPSYVELMRQILDGPVPPLVAPGVSTAFGALVARALERDRERRWRARDLRDALARWAGRGGALGLPAGNPYRGLAAFEAEHRGLFFGREGEIWSLVERLRSERFVLVAGDSGVGKSSLVRAGVLPQLADGEDGLVRAIVTPGRRPQAALAAALAAALGDPAPGEPPLDDGAAPAGRLRQRLQARPLVLFVDQMEELLTLAPPEEAAAAADLLARLSDEVPSLRLIGAVRSDFLGRLSTLGRLGERVGRALYLLAPLTPQRLREAIVGPATITGVRFESPALVDALAASCGGPAPGALPLLQFALSQLWEARDLGRAMICAETLASLGGVAGALARHADGVLASLPPERRLLARRLLTALVTPEGTRGHCTAGELLADDDADAARQVLEALVQGRLVTVADGGDAAGPTYQIAHDVLVDGWDTLRGWRAQELERGAVRQRLRRAALEWQRLDRPADALWNRRQLAEAGGLEEALLGATERAFLRQSRRAARRRRAALRALALGVPLLLGAGFAAATLRTHRRVARAVADQVRQAVAAAVEAHTAAARATAARQRAFAAFDAGHGDEGERLWDVARAAARDADGALGRAAESLELALAFDGARHDTRQRLAAVLAARARLAERARRPTVRDELLRRLAAYDDGREQARWSVPARLSLATTPPGAAVVAQRYDDVDGRRRLGPPQPLGASPVVERTLAPGSYLLTLRRAGHPDVRYPVLLARGEQARFSVELTVDPPAGYVYVPRGRFLYGSDDDDELRRTLLGAPPLHQTATAGFFIGRDEVTFADWLAFLRALPPGERARRRPRTPAVDASVDGALLALDEGAGGAARIVLQPSGRRYTARRGEPIRYAGRATRAVQRWERMPVSGISWDDALAYARWLDRSGRLPGARPCTQREWERAARGADDRLFPHGDRLAGDDADIDETYGRQPAAFGPDEVGSHPASDSPFGVSDLAGNVWEWVAAGDGHDGAVIRGGGWYNNALSARSNNREPTEPTMRSIVIGFRVCADAP